MPRRYQRRLGARPYQNYAHETLMTAVDNILIGKISFRKAAQEFKIPVNTLVQHVQRAKLKNASKSSTTLNEDLPAHSEEAERARKHGGQPILTEDEERVIASHIIGMSTFGFPVNTVDLRVIVGNYLDKLGRAVPRLKNNVPGPDWVEGFLKRNPDISSRMAKNISTGRAATSRGDVISFYDHLKNELRDVPPENIYNFDETNLVDDPGSTKVLVKRGTKYPERIMNSTKACTTLMQCGNAAGETLAPYVIYKAEGIFDTWQEGGPPGTRYNRSKSGWIDATIFSDWFEFHMLPVLKTKPGKKVIISDNLSSHFNPRVLTLCAENNVSFVALPPNATHLLQPLDVAYFRPMKGEWRKVLGEWKKTPYGRRCGTIPKGDFPKLLRVLMEQLEPKSCDNLKAGFRKCGIYPFNPSEVLDRLHDSVMDNLPQHKENIGNSFMDFLSQTRTSTVEVRRRNKRLNLPPGKGITANALEHARSAPTALKKAAPKKKKETTQKKQNGKPAAKKNARKKNPKKKSTRLSSDSEEDSADYSVQDSDASNSWPAFSDIDDSPVVPAGCSRSGDELTPAEIQTRSYDIGDYVEALFENKSVPGIVTRKDGQDCELSVMKMKNKNWVWPAIERKFWFSTKNLLRKISEPLLHEENGTVFFKVDISHS